jgi:hypothetical protein
VLPEEGLYELPEEGLELPEDDLEPPELDLKVCPPPGRA